MCKFSNKINNNNTKTKKLLYNYYSKFFMILISKIKLLTYMTFFKKTRNSM